MTARAIVTALGLTAALVLPGCGGERSAQGGSPVDSARFALLTSGPVSDAGWYAGGYEGLLLLRDSLGASVSHQQTRTPAEFDEAFRAYGSAGYDIVFARGLSVSEMSSILRDCGRSHWTGTVVRYYCYPIAE